MAASVSSSASAVDRALELVEEMSFVEKLAFNAKLAALLAKETKGAGVMAKAAKKEKKAKGDGPKRQISAGTRAWQAFHKHCKETMPERFADTKLEKEKLAVSKAIRAEDMAAYDAFVADFKSKYEASTAASGSEDEAEEVESKPTSPVLSAKEKFAAMKAKAASASASAAAAGGAKAAKEEKPKVKKAVKAAKAAAKAEPKAVEVEEDGSLTQITVDGVKYHMDTSTKGLWKVGGDGGFGAWKGYFENGAIRETECPDDC